MALRICLAAGFLSTGWGQSIQETPASEVEPPSAGQISLWVKQLDDDRFGVRTNATDKLVLAGAAAVGPVSKAVEKGNLEVATRAIYVLRELALSLDVAAQDQGLEALQELAGSRKRSAARLAREAIHDLGEARQQQTMDQLARLGASIQEYRSPGFAPLHLLEVEIGAEWQGSLKDLQCLRWLRDLYKITFAGPQVTDSWIETIRDLPHLNYVAIKSARITDDALLIISRLKTVVYVDVMYTPITDAGFKHLRTMKSVRRIRCFGTKVTREAAHRFQADLANVEVQHKMGAFLGVRCQRPPWPCAVTGFAAESAAREAGVKVGDIVVGYDKQAVANFGDLERAIARNKVGDTVEIQVARGGESVIGAISRQPPQALGLEGEPTPIGIKVKKAEANGAAAKAGVREGDLIVALDDQRVANMDQLQKLYKKDVPDRTGRLRILRNVKIETIKVTFGQWNE